MFDPVLVARSWVSTTKWAPLAKLCGIKKNRYNHNFQNIASKMNQRWVIDYDPTLIRFRNDILKIVAVSVFLTPHFSFCFFLENRVNFGRP